MLQTKARETRMILDMAAACITSKDVDKNVS